MTFLRKVPERKNPRTKEEANMDQPGPNEPQMVIQAPMKVLDTEREIRALHKSSFRTGVKASPVAKEILHERFIEILQEKPEYIDTLLECGKYIAVSHWCEDCKHRKAGLGDCDNCHSGDTDCEMKGDMSDLLGKLWNETCTFMGDDEEAESGDDDDQDESE